MNERVAVYPGSFDPVTLGHEDMIHRAAAMFDRVIVAVLHNPAKQGWFPVSERIRLLEQVTQTLPQVRIAQWDGMLVDFLRRTDARIVLRGLRQTEDFASEMTMAQINSRLLPDMETVFLMTRPEYGCVSSSAVREIASFGGDVSGFVSEGVAKEIAARCQR